MSSELPYISLEEAAVTDLCESCNARKDALTRLKDTLGPDGLERIKPVAARVVGDCVEGPTHTGKCGTYRQVCNNEHGQSGPELAMFMLQELTELPE
jgi:hypothetical protein